MNCPVCGKEARAHIYYYARCAVYVREKCWQKHIAVAHREEEANLGAERRKRTY